MGRFQKGVELALYLMMLSSGQGAFAQQPTGYTSFTNPAGTPSYKVDITQYGQLNGGSGVSEFGYDPSDTYQQWPICGSNRVAVSGDGSFTVSSASSSSFPNAYKLDGSTNYAHVANQNFTMPVYGFDIGSRCICVSDSMNPRSIPYTATDAAVTRLSQSNASGKPRFYPTTMDELNQLTPTGSYKYGPIAVGNVGEPRMYSNLYGATPTSACSCPNMNEIAVPIPGWGGDPIYGSSCSAMINSTPIDSGGTAAYPDAANTSPLVLATYDPADTIASNWKDGIASAGTPATTTVSVPNSRTDLQNTTTYSRKIWACEAPYELVSGSGTSNGNCVFNQAHNACDDGTGGGPISPYPGSFSASSLPTAAGFNTIANPKLACCLNAYFLDSTTGKALTGSGLGNFSKFDCVESAAAATDFNTLWASADSATDGGKLNAIVLWNSHSQPVTGFYSLKGTRCSQLSEFAGALQPMTVDPANSGNAQVKVGGTGVAVAGTPLPTPSSAAYATIKAAALARSYRVPSYNAAAPSAQDFQDYRGCPILVRAAMVAKCPTFSKPPLALNQMVYGGVTRCPAAASIQIQIRIEQLFTITGQPKFKTIDTLSDASQAASVDIASILNAKNGDSCPPGTHKEGDLCSY